MLLGRHTNAMMVLGKVLQAGGLAFLGVSWILGLPQPPAARNLAIAGALSVAGWLVLRGTGGSE